MPVKITKLDGSYRVSTPGGTKAKGTTAIKAKRQANLLRGIEHGWKPTGTSARRFNKSTKGSPPFTAEELTKGYRKIS